MKKYYAGIIAAGVIMMTMLAGCQSGGSYSNGNVTLNTKIDSVSYATGFNVGKSLSRHGMQNIEPNLFAQGMSVALSGDSSIIPPLQKNAMLRRYHMQKRHEMIQKRKKKAKKNKQKGQAFLEKTKVNQALKQQNQGWNIKS